MELTVESVGLLTYSKLAEGDLCVYHNTYIPIKIIPGGEENLHLSKHQWKVLHHSGSKVGRLITKHGKLIKEREISDLVGQVKTSH